MLPPPPMVLPPPPPTVYIIRNEQGSFHYEPVGRIRNPGSHYGEVVVRWPGLYTEVFTNCSNVPANIPWLTLHEASEMAGPGLLFPRTSASRSGRWYRCPYVERGCHYELSTCRGRPERSLVTTQRDLVTWMGNFDHHLASNGDWLD